MALALREEDPDTLFFSRRLRMEGDTDLGLLVKNTLDAVDWDALKQKAHRPALSIARADCRRTARAPGSAWVRAARVLHRVCVKGVR